MTLPARQNRQLRGATSSSSHPRTSRYRAPQRSRSRTASTGYERVISARAFCRQPVASASCGRRPINARRNPGRRRKVDRSPLGTLASERAQRPVSAPTSLSLVPAAGRSDGTAAPAGERPRGEVRTAQTGPARGLSPRARRSTAFCARTRRAVTRRRSVRHRRPARRGRPPEETVGPHACGPTARRQEPTGHEIGAAQEAFRRQLL